MNRKWLVLGVVGLAVSVATTRVFSGDDKPAGGDAGAKQIAEMMKKWIEMSSPGAAHKKLDELAGSWDTVTKTWMGGPGSPPSESKGHSTSKWVLNGRFLMDEYHGEIMMPGMDGKLTARPFDGIGMLGYDNVRKMYVGSWCDSMGTQLLTYKGGFDEAGKVLTVFGEMDEPDLGVYGRWVKYVTRIVDHDTHVFTIYDLHAGSDNYKVMEVTYTRTK